MKKVTNLRIRYDRARSWVIVGTLEDGTCVDLGGVVTAIAVNYVANTKNLVPKVDLTVYPDSVDLDRLEIGDVTICKIPSST